jgi:pimeloyl-ACP methyl ester carboxylesterase
MKINFVRRGSGEPLVLLHGLGHRWQAWSPVMDRLAEHHDVMAIDLPGFGESPVPLVGLSRDIPALADGIGAFLAAEGMERPHVAGNSLGGALALELALAGRARSATAFSPAGFATMADRRAALLTLRVLRATAFLPLPLVRAMLRIDGFRAYCFSRLVAHPGRLDLERAYGDTLALRRGRGFEPVVRAARHYEFRGCPDVPVTVAWADGDRILPPRQAAVAKRLLPSTRHVMLRDCGHVPMSDCPDEVAALILETTGALAPGAAAEKGDLDKV